MKEQTIGIVNPGCLPAIWPDVQELLEAHGEALLREYSLKELFCCVLSGTYDLWIVSEETELKMLGFCAWEKHEHLSNYHVLWVGGSGLRRLKEAIPVVEKYACMNGASKLIFGGRPGWDRLLKPMGFAAENRWSKTVATLH